MPRITDFFLAVLGGVLLAFMIHYNSLLAKSSSALMASWVAHAVGACVTLAFVLFFSFVMPRNKPAKQVERKRIWTYFGGIPGAMTVVLAAITVNSVLGFSGSLAFMLVGQVLFGVLTDIFGLLGAQKRALVSKDFWVVLLVLTGSWIIIFFRS